MQHSFKPIPALIALLLGATIWFIIPVPADVSPQAWHLLALFVGVIAAIIGKAMPIGALSMLAIALVAVTGVTNEKPAAAMRDALSSFSDPLIWLIGVSIMISRGLQKTGLGARIGYYFISLFGKNTVGIGYGLAFSELLLSPVTPSNTARGGGIIHPIMRSIADSYDSRPETQTQNRIGKYLALVNYHSNPITSAMFITATAPNPLIVDIVAKATGLDIQLSWGTWALAMFLPGLAAIIIMPLALYWLYPPEIKHTPNAVEFAKGKLAELGKMNRGEKIMLATFALLLLLWAGIPAMIFGKAWAVNATATAFIGISILLITGVLSWDDILQEKSAWDTIIWFGALVMMATQLSKLGLISWFSQHMELGIEHLGLNWFWTSLLLILAYLYAHYMFASTTAHISAMLAVFYSAGIAIGVPPMLFALQMIAASSIMMGLTHYATGTSPVIFGSNYTTLGEWWKAGFAMSVVNLIIFLGVGGIWWKLLGFW